MHWIKVEPCYVEAQGPPLSTEVSFVRIDPGNWKLPQASRQPKGVKLSISKIANYNISLIFRIPFLNSPSQHQPDGWGVYETDGHSNLTDPCLSNPCYPGVECIIVWQQV